ncbi:ATP-binding protein [Marinicella sp. S1101]|uniref:ATP-binding protein n=1 Tax=Marinicella marina TaxID=2996016 RepID=UPI002260829A|nr:ATP-binding protein [Marinicella marina]MCX7554533.1 ATP-binding protein [Marinicella marina]MDJ1141083.1 ATP-binding protein [Marinicella marina]
MKLKWQITIIAILSLSFPWVVWQAFKSLNQTFQSNMLDAAAKQAQVIVKSVQQFNQSNAGQLEGLIVTALGPEPAIDGSDGEWTTLPWYVADNDLKFKLGSSQNQLHLLVAVNDHSPVINPNQISDQLLLVTGSSRGINRFTINRQAEGDVGQNLTQNQYQAYWHEVEGGYQVEVQLADSDITRLGLAAINHSNDDNTTMLGYVENQQIQLQPLFQQLPHWQTFLQQITPEDGEIKLFDAQGRIYYHSQNTEFVPKPENWLTELIYEFAFDQSQNDASDFFGQSVSEAFADGRIELTIKHDAAQSALIQSFISSIMWIFVIALGLLACYFIYALILAWRIRGLNKKLQTALDESGHIETTLPSNNARDEIGDLSRGMSALLSQINDYTEYLKQLGNRLSHEMKTPISIVHTSLENLHMEQPENAFVERALNANHRLKFILNQLSALSQLKQVIAETDRDTFDLNQLLNELCEGYQLQANHINYQTAPAPVMIRGSQELLAQMLDKLIQNALDFTTEVDQIDVILTTKDNSYCLQVRNTGSQIPADKSHQLFDSLTSFRQKKDQQPHLGLGLYVAKLICDFHQAEIKAANQAPATVTFSVTGPLV